MLVHAPLLCKWGLTGPLHISSKLLRLQVCAAHSEYITSANAAPQQSLPDATQFFFYKMAHDKVFGIRCKRRLKHLNYLINPQKFTRWVERRTYMRAAP